MKIEPYVDTSLIDIELFQKNDTGDIELNFNFSYPEVFEFSEVEGVFDKKVLANYPQFYLTVLDSLENQIYSTMEDDFPSKDSTLSKKFHINTVNFYSLLEGENTVYFELKISHIAFQDANKIPKEPIFIYRIKTKIKVPKILGTEISFKSFELSDSAKTDLYDQTFFLNKKYKPDLYWYLNCFSCNEDYSSSVIKNTLKYEKASKSIIYHLNNEEDVWIYVMDNDNFINSDDLIGKWNGTFENLLHDDYINIPVVNTKSFYIKLNNLGYVNEKRF